MVHLAPVLQGIGREIPLPHCCATQEAAPIHPVRIILLGILLPLPGNPFVWQLLNDRVQGSMQDMI